MRSEQQQPGRTNEGEYPPAGAGALPASHSYKRGGHGIFASRCVEGAGETEASVRVEILDPDRMLSAERGTWLGEHARQAVDVIGLGTGGCSGEVRVRLVDDRRMTEAHKRHMGMDSTTDVLTFDMAEGGAARGEALDVDILVCVDEAQRQSAARGFAVERELLLYIVHGVLHCVGEDDHDEASYARMHAREDEVLRAIGVGATFDADGLPRAREGEAC
jgi:probable rRNA maturation factor